MELPANEQRLVTAIKGGRIGARNSSHSVRVALTDGLQRMVLQARCAIEAAKVDWTAYSDDGGDTARSMPASRSLSLLADRQLDYYEMDTDVEGVSLSPTVMDDYARARKHLRDLDFELFDLGTQAALQLGRLGPWSEAQPAGRLSNYIEALDVLSSASGVAVCDRHLIADARSFETIDFYSPAIRHKAEKLAPTGSYFTAAYLYDRMATLRRSMRDIEDFNVEPLTLSNDLSMKHAMALTSPTNAAVFYELVVIGRRIMEIHDWIASRIFVTDDSHADMSRTEAFARAVLNINMMCIRDSLLAGDAVSPYLIGNSCHLANHIMSLYYTGTTVPRDGDADAMSISGSELAHDGVYLSELEDALECSRTYSIDAAFDFLNALTRL